MAGRISKISRNSYTIPILLVVIIITIGCFLMIFMPKLKNLKQQQENFGCDMHEFFSGSITND